MIVTNNIIAMNAQRQFNIVGTSKKKSTEKLSSGYKINRAADDAAGLTISEKMRSQIRGLHQASENCQDGVSYVQVADGALNEVHDMLQRMNELSVQSANGTNSDADRKAIDNEFQQLKSEMDRIFTTTEFNQRRIWPGDEIEINRTQIGTTTGMGVERSRIDTEYSLNENNKLATPQDCFKITADDNGIIVKWKGYNNKEYSSDVIPWSKSLAGSHSFMLSDYIDITNNPECKGINLKYSYDVSQYATIDDVISCLNGDKIYTSSRADTERTFSTKSGKQHHFIQFSTCSIALDSLIKGDVNIDYNDSEFITSANNGHNAVSNPVANPDTDNKWEFLFNVRNIGDILVTSNETPQYIFCFYDHSKTDIFKDGECTLEELKELLDERYAQGGNADGEVYLPHMPVNDPNVNHDLFIYGLRIRLAVNSSDDKDTIINKFADLDGMSFTVLGGTARTECNASTKSLSIEEPIYEEETIVKENLNNVNIMAGASSSQNNIININYDNLRLKKLGLDNTNVLTEESSTKAIDEIANALNIISDQRSYFGAVQNRMEHTIANLDNIVENTQAAESRIRDTDMAKEMVNNTKLNILEQAVTSMMAQANQSNQGVLSLLQ